MLMEWREMTVDLDILVTIFYNVEVLYSDHSLYPSKPLVVRRITTDCDQNENGYDEYGQR